MILDAFKASSWSLRLDAVFLLRNAFTVTAASSSHDYYARHRSSYDSIAMVEARSKTWRIGLIGYPFAGKTTLARQYCDSFHPSTYTSHRSIEVYSGRSQTGQSVLFYEVPGQSQYIELYDVSRLALSGLIFVFNDAIEPTYKRLDYLITFCLKYALDGLPGLILCNNCPEKQPQSQHSGPALAHHYSYSYQEMDLREDLGSIRRAVDLLLV